MNKELSNNFKIKAQQCLTDMRHAYLCHLRLLQLSGLISEVCLSNLIRNCYHVLSMNHLSITEFRLCPMEVAVIVKHLENNCNAHNKNSFNNAFATDAHFDQILFSISDNMDTYPSITSFSYNAGLSQTGQFHVGLRSFICKYNDASKHCK